MIGCPLQSAKKFSQSGSETYHELTFQVNPSCIFLKLFFSSSEVKCYRIFPAFFSIISIVVEEVKQHKKNDIHSSH